MEEGREGEQQAGGGSQEKGQLERSEKEELKDLSGEPLRRTRTLERQVRRKPQCCKSKYFSC